MQPTLPQDQLTKIAPFLTSLGSDQLLKFCASIRSWLFARLLKKLSRLSTVLKRSFNLINCSRLPLQVNGHHSHSLRICESADCMVCLPLSARPSQHSCSAVQSPVWLQNQSKRLFFLGRKNRSFFGVVSFNLCHAFTSTARCWSKGLLDITFQCLSHVLFKRTLLADTARTKSSFVWVVFCWFVCSG